MVVRCLRAQAVVRCPSVSSSCRAHRSVDASRNPTQSKSELWLPPAPLCFRSCLLVNYTPKIVMFSDTHTCNDTLKRTFRKNSSTHTHVGRSAPWLVIFRSGRVLPASRTDETNRGLAWSPSSVLSDQRTGKMKRDPETRIGLDRVRSLARNQLGQRTT